MGQRLKYWLHKCVCLPKLEIVAFDTLLYINYASIKFISEHNENNDKVQNQGMRGYITQREPWSWMLRRWLPV